MRKEEFRQLQVRVAAARPPLILDDTFFGAAALQKCFRDTDGTFSADRVDEIALKVNMLKTSLLNPIAGNQAACSQALRVADLHLQHTASCSAAQRGATQTGIVAHPHFADDAIGGQSDEQGATQTPKGRESQNRENADPLDGDDSDGSSSSSSSSSGKGDRNQLRG